MNLRLSLGISRKTWANIIPDFCNQSHRSRGFGAIFLENFHDMIGVEME